jgi:hypothetical protein
VQDWGSSAVYRFPCFLRILLYWRQQLLDSEGVPRRALGDIGNLVGPFNSRCNVGKENGGGKKGTLAAVVSLAVPSLARASPYCHIPIRNSITT